MEKYDFAIVGGGMTGAATAIGLAKLGYLVAVIEQVQPLAYDPEQPIDLRVSAISQSSVDFLKKLNAWQHIVKKRLCRYKRLETWEHSECRVKFDADMLNIEQLGFIVENRLIQLGLWEEFGSYDNIKVITSTKVANISFHSEYNQLTLDNNQKIKSRWTIGADGAESYVRKAANIGVTAWDYRQHCMLINIETEEPQQDITWQWFTPSGPRAFLPLSGSRASLVWYDSPARIKQLITMSPSQLQNEIVSHFPKELGRFSVIQSGSFPLTRRHAQHYVVQRCILLGDAAHTINPLAGQGVNLGFKDSKTLIEEVEKNGIESESAFFSYQSKRKADNLLMQTGMDLFYTVFSHPLPPIHFLRNIGFKLVNSTEILKKKVLKYALGF